MKNSKGFTLIELLIVIAIIGIIAAIAIPSLLRARVSANEAQAIGDTRTVISAEQTYAASNGGFFGHLEDLSRPGIGIPAYPTAAPEFLGADVGRAPVYTKSGYDRNLVENGMPNAVTSNQDPNSLLDYCYVSTPAQLGLTGARSFTGSGAGALFVSNDGMAIACPVPIGTAFLE